MKSVAAEIFKAYDIRDIADTALTQADRRGCGTQGTLLIRVLIEKIYAQTVQD